MSNLRLIIDNQADEATLTASPAATSSLPVTNLQEAPRTRVMRSTSAADQRVLGDQASGKVADGLALARHNLSTDATIRLRLFDSTAQAGAVVYDSGDVQVVEPIAAGVFQAGVDAWGEQAQPYDTIFALWFAAVAYQSFEITIKDAANPDGYLQASRLFLGLSLVPSVNFDWGAQLEFVENTTQLRTAGGSLRSEGGTAHRRISLDLSHLPVSDREQFVREFRRAGKMRDLLLSAYPDAAGALAVDYTMITKLASENRYTSVIGGRYQTHYVFDEA